MEKSAFVFLPLDRPLGPYHVTTNLKKLSWASYYLLRFPHADQ